MNPTERNEMIRFVKSFMFEIALFVVGYIAYTALKVVGRMTLLLGRAVFSR
jgi:hypothetical protein